MRRPVLVFDRFCRLPCALSAAAALCLSVGCYSTGEGISPPEDRVYFPVGLALVNDADHLVVVNSDFDLQFNAGTLGVLDMTVVRPHFPKPCASNDDCSAATPVCDTTPTAQNSGVPGYVCVDSGGDHFGDPCGSLGTRPLADQLLHPGRCEPLDPEHPPNGEAFFTDKVKIGAFATDVVYRTPPAGVLGDAPNGRLFIPVRGDRTLTWADISRDGKIDCGQALADGACNDAHRAGNDPGQENSRDLSLAPEPFAIDVSSDGRVALVTHQTTGAVSVFSNCWSTADGYTGVNSDTRTLQTCANPTPGPSLQFTLGGLPQRPVGVAALAPPALIAAQGEVYPPGFLITFRTAPEIDLVRYYADSTPTTDPSLQQPQAGAREVRPYASLVSRAGIGVNSSGADSRGIAIDSSARDQADAKCARDSGIGLDCATSKACVDGLDPDANKALLDCFKSAAATSLDVYVANRTPSTLLLGRTMPAWNALQSTESPVFYDSIPLTQGPSRVVVGDVIVGDANGNPVLERRIFVAAFDSRRIFVYDPIQRRVDVEIATGRGPHALAIDSANGWLYVGHFTDSFIGVVSLDRRFFRTYGKMLATIGKPVAPRASK